MSTFAYTALGKDGARTSGTLAADSRAAALQQISSQGLRPVTLDESRDAAARRALRVDPKKSSRIPQKAVESFTRELASLLAGSIPLSRALALLKRESSHPAARALWAQIYEDVVGGKSLAEALAKSPKVFSNVYVAMVRAGETGGFLDVVLGQIADFRTREQELKGKVKAAMVYPCILGCVAVGVLVMLLTFFIPRFSGIFQQFGGNLPVLTSLIMDASAAVKQYGWIAAIVIILLIVVLKRSLNTKLGRQRMDQFQLAIPMIGNLKARFALVRFARMLGTLVGAGVPLISSLRVAREAIGNQTLADTVLNAIEQVQRGSPLSKSLANCPKLFPSSVVEMIAVAEETARLDKELLRLAALYEADLDRELRMVVSVVEPAMLFLMAAIIGTVVLAMLMPIFNLGSLIH